MSSKYSLNLHNDGAVFFTEEIEVMLLAALTRSPLSAQIHWRYFCSSGHLLPFIDLNLSPPPSPPPSGCIFDFWNLYFESPVWPTVCVGFQFMVIVGDEHLLKWVIQLSSSVTIFFCFPFAGYSWVSIQMAAGIGYLFESSDFSVSVFCFSGWCWGLNSGLFSCLVSVVPPTTVSALCVFLMSIGSYRQNRW